MIARCWRVCDVQMPPFVDHCPHKVCIGTDHHLKRARVQTLKVTRKVNMNIRVSPEKILVVAEPIQESCFGMHSRGHYRQDKRASHSGFKSGPLRPGCTDGRTCHDHKVVFVTPYPNHFGSNDATAIGTSPSGSSATYGRVPCASAIDTRFVKYRHESAQEGTRSGA